MLTCTRVRPDDVEPGDEIAFDYRRADENSPSRVGIVAKIAGSREKGNLCLVMWDYTLRDDSWVRPGKHQPNYRSYSFDFITYLARIDDVPSLPTESNPLTLYQRAIVAFGRLFYDRG